jgi:hypothetical protein
MPNGHYKRVKGAGDPASHGAQDALMARYAEPAGQGRE